MELKTLINFEKKVKRERSILARNFLIGCFIGAILLLGLCAIMLFAIKESPRNFITFENNKIHICDYCDASYKKPSAYAFDIYVPLHAILYNEGGDEERRLCMVCFVKVFDIVLGDPIYKKGKEVK